MYTNGPTNTSPEGEAPPLFLRPEEDPPRSPGAIQWAARYAHVESAAARASAWLKRPYPLVHAVACAALLLIGCGGGSADVAEEGTTAAKCADEEPKIRQAPGGVVIGYCGAVRYLSAAEIAAGSPWAVRPTTGGAR